AATDALRIKDFMFNLPFWFSRRAGPSCSLELRAHLNLPFAAWIPPPPQGFPALTRMASFQPRLQTLETHPSFVNSPICLTYHISETRLPDDHSPTHCTNDVC